MKIHSNFRNFDTTTAILLLNLDDNFSEVHRCVRKYQNSLRIAETLQNILENNYPGDNISSFRMNNVIQFLPVIAWPWLLFPGGSCLLQIIFVGQQF